MKWLCRKVYTLKEEVGENGESNYRRDEFSHIEVSSFNDGPLPRGTDEAFDWIKLEGEYTKHPKIIEDEEGDFSVIEDAEKLEDATRENVYMNRIQKAPELKAKLAVMLSKIPENDAIANTSALSMMQALAENGSWTTLRNLVGTATLPQVIKDAMTEYLDAHLATEPTP